MLNLRFGTLAGLLWWIATTGMTCLPVALTGCNNPNKTEEQRQGTFDRQMQGLKAARFKGKVILKTAGSPFGFTQSTTFAFGPQTMIAEADGSVDFSEPNMTSGLPALPEEWAQAVDGTLSAINRRLDALGAPKTPTP